MPQQAALLWPHLLQLTTGSTLLNQCKKLLQSDNTACSNAMPLSFRWNSTNGFQYDFNHPRDGTPYLHHFQRLYHFSIPPNMERTDHRNRPGKWSWSPNLGSSKLPNPWYHAVRWFLCAPHCSNLHDREEAHWLHICQQYQPMCLWPTCGLKKCLRVHATAGGPMGRAALSYRRCLSPHKSLLVPHQFLMEK